MLKKILFICFFIFPFTGNAQGAPSGILFSEIAWMGTDEADVGRYNEWIEIYNFSNNPTDLTGWTVTSADGKISISLKCTLAPHGVAVLERTDENTLPDITELLTYTGELVNGGTTLTIKDPSGNISHEVVGGENWSNIGGTNVTPKQTPQYTPSGWVTAPPTPMGQSAAGDAGTSNVTCPPPVQVNENEDNNTATTVVRSSGGGSSKKKTESTLAENVDPVLKITITAPRIAYVNQEISFDAVPSGIGQTFMRSLGYMWNFGDTYTGTGRVNTHVFQYPGEYVVVVEAEFAKQRAMVRHEITVLPISLTLSRATNGAVLLKNGSKQEVDLGGFTLQGTSGFTFPKFTFLKAGGSLTIAAGRINVASGDAVALFDTQSVLVVRDGFSIKSKEVVVLSKPMMQKSVTAVSATFADAPEVATSETVTEVAPSSEEVVATIPIGHLATTDGTSPGFFKSLFSRVFNFFGL